MSAPLPQSSPRGLSGTALKTLACLCMLADHIGASCLEAGVLLLPDAPQGLFSLDLVLRLAGRLAFPIYCFLLTEGFVHTSDRARYAQRLLLFAVLSEIPFDWAFYRDPFYTAHQNVYWTLLFGLAALWSVDYYRPEGEHPSSWKGIACALLFAGCAVALHTDYDAFGVLLILLLYRARSSRTGQCLLGGVVTCWEITAPLAFVAIWKYSGQRGRCSKLQSQLFYWFYPAHLLVLGVLTNLILT